MKNLHAIEETWVSSMGHEDPPEEGNGHTLRILARRIPRTEKPSIAGLQSMGLQRVQTGLSNPNTFTFHAFGYISFRIFLSKTTKTPFSEAVLINPLNFLVKEISKR